jgi:hypothetical protein
LARAWHRFRAPQWILSGEAALTPDGLPEFERHVDAVVDGSARARYLETRATNPLRNEI